MKIFISKYGKEKFFIFGFTSLIYEFLIKKNFSKLQDLNLSNSILLHGGGWKKMEKSRIDNLKFKMLLKESLN